MNLSDDIEITAEEALAVLDDRESVASMTIAGVELIERPVAFGVAACMILSARVAGGLVALAPTVGRLFVGVRGGEWHYLDVRPRSAWPPAIAEAYAAARRRLGLEA